MAFHHIHNQNIRHTHSFVVTGKKKQCSDVVWPQPFMIKAMTIGLILHPVGLDRRGGEGQASLQFSMAYWKHDLCFMAIAHLPVCHYSPQGRSLHPGEQRQSFEVVKFWKFHRRWQQSRGKKSKSKPQPRGQVSLVQPRENSQAAGTDSLVKQQGYSAQPWVLLQQRYTSDIFSSTIET